MERGDVVTHKASGIKMVVLIIRADSQTLEEVKCRYYNPITGEFQVGDFRTYEF